MATVVHPAPTMHAHAHPTALREGILVGAVGATAVALWFLAVDLIAGRALYTPTVLGRSLFGLFGSDAPSSAIASVAIYTLFHYAAFSLVGMIVVRFAHGIERNSTLLSAFVMLFFAFEVAWIGVTALFAEVLPLGGLAWYQVLGGNLLAAALMGVWVWRTHPLLREELTHTGEYRVER